MINKAGLLLFLGLVFAFRPVAYSGEKADEPETEDLYKIGCSDILEINTWKEPDLSREVFVRIDGKITFPLVGDIRAADKTPPELKQDVEKILSQYVADPIVTVTVRASNSKKFYVLGEVNTTNEYPLVKKLTVLQAFAIAGGFTEWASKKEIILVRRENGKDKIIRINYKDIIRGKLEKNIEIQENDILIVP